MPKSLLTYYPSLSASSPVNFSVVVRGALENEGLTSKGPDVTKDLKEEINGRSY